MSEEAAEAAPERLLMRVRSGDEQALGKLLHVYQPYLSLLARLKADRQLRAKLDDSDLVQDTCLSAHRDFAHSRGAREPEFTAWLREIMAQAAAKPGPRPPQPAAGRAAGADCTISSINPPQ